MSFLLGVQGLHYRLEISTHHRINLAQRTINRIKDDVSSGIQLNTSMKSQDIFPNMVIQMVAIGEESGALDGMLDKAATYYEEMVDNAVEGLTSLMEPMIMAFLGVVIGGLIIAMYLPIFGMGDAIGGGGGH